MRWVPMRCSRLPSTDFTLSGCRLSAWMRRAVALLLSSRLGARKAVEYDTLSVPSVHGFHVAATRGESTGENRRSESTRAPPLNLRCSCCYPGLLAVGRLGEVRVIQAGGRRIERSSGRNIQRLAARLDRAKTTVDAQNGDEFAVAKPIPACVCSSRPFSPPRPN